MVRDAVRSSCVGFLGFCLDESWWSSHSSQPHMNREGCNKLEIDQSSSSETTETAEVSLIIIPPNKRHKSILRHHPSLYRASLTGGQKSSWKSTIMRAGLKGLSFVMIAVFRFNLGVYFIKSVRLQSESFVATQERRRAMTMWNGKTDQLIRTERRIFGPALPGISQKSHHYSLHREKKYRLSSS